MTMNGCKLENSNRHCLIKWYETNYTNNVPTSVTATTVPSSLISLSFNNMGTDLGVKELILDWINAVYDDYGDTGLAQRYVTCNNVNWSGVSVDDLLLLSKIPSSNNRRRITGYILSSDTFTSAEVVAIENAFGSGVFTNEPGVPLRIDAASGFIMALPSELDAGTTMTVKAVSFPIADNTAEITYTLGHFEGNNYIASTAVNGVYTYKGATLYKDANNNVILSIAETITDFGNDDYYYIGVYGTNGVSGDSIKIKVKKKIYPTVLDFTLTHNGDEGDVFYDETNASYYVVDDNLLINIAVTTTPEEITGTPVLQEWSHTGIIGNYSITESDENHLVLSVPVAGATLKTATLTHTKTYVDNYSVSKTITFRLQSPVNVVTNAINSHLQSVLYSAEVAANVNYTRNFEAWTVTDLDDLGIFDSGSQLVHLGELNNFINLNMTTLDMSNCNDLGSYNYFTQYF
jgi:hypothetical protein